MTAVTDLLALTAELVDVPSVSHHEGPLADLVEARLRAVGGLEVVRAGDNVVARTHLGRGRRLVLAGHLDTVPPAGNARARLDGDVCWGVGAADMKGGLAVMLALVEEVAEPAVDLTLVCYAAEEVAHEHSGLGWLADVRPDLLAGDAALLGEPTGGALEAGCQGTMRLRVTLRGARAHSARPWMGRNAVHRLSPLLARLNAYEPRTVLIEGCEFREALQAVALDAGVSGNVVPDEAVLTVNHRFAPDRSTEEAERHVRSALGLDAVVEPADTVEVVDLAPAAPPAVSHPLVAALVARNGLTVQAKLGWTDVARFAALGVPAANFGPGEPTLAHTADERVDRAALERVHTALRDLVTVGA